MHISLTLLGRYLNLSLGRIEDAWDEDDVEPMPEQRTYVAQERHCEEAAYAVWVDGDD